MDAIGRDSILQRWRVVQHELLPQFRGDWGGLPPGRQGLVPVLEWVRIEEFTGASRSEVRRPAHERAWMANAFVAKAVLGLTTTVALIERLRIDRSLRRICGFEMYRRLPSEATFSRAFGEFAVSVQSATFFPAC